MHTYLDQAEFLEDIGPVVAAYFLLVAVANLVAAWHGRRTGRAPCIVRLSGRWPVTTAALWTLWAIAFLGLSVLAWSGYVEYVGLPQWWRDTCDRWATPLVFFGGSTVLMVVLFLGRRILARPPIAWLLANGVWLLFGLSLTDQDFAQIVLRPDNIAIVSMVFLMGYFTWLATWQAVQNDERSARGMGPKEAELMEEVLVWPDLVYIELICMVLLMALLIFWSIAVPAPLEEPASPVNTPNPSKAPWYFVGLQELLYYYDPWMAGVVIPGLILFGLSAIPYLDRNPKGNGYYTIRERKFAYVIFQFGFLVLWLLPILAGTFFRGPNWSFFGPYETWDPHFVPAQVNVNVSRWFWVDLLGQPLPEPANGVQGLSRLGIVLYRELPGLILMTIYFVGLPPLLARTTRFFRQLKHQLGTTRYAVTIFLLLLMVLLPVKMVARWTFNLQYFIAMPEYLLSF